VGRLLECRSWGWVGAGGPSLILQLREAAWESQRAMLSPKATKHIMCTCAARRQAGIQCAAVLADAGHIYTSKFLAPTGYNHARLPYDTFFPVTPGAPAALNPGALHAARSGNEAETGAASACCLQPLPGRLVVGSWHFCMLLVLRLAWCLGYSANSRCQGWRGAVGAAQAGFHGWRQQGGLENQ
jgi:hypothetical protein